MSSKSKGRNRPSADNKGKASKPAVPNHQYKKGNLVYYRFSKDSSYSHIATVIGVSENRIHISIDTMPQWITWVDKDLIVLRDLAPKSIQTYFNYKKS